MENLTPEQQKICEEFCFELAMIDGPDDMFPPDSGDRAPLEPKGPQNSSSEKLCLAAVYDLCQYRSRRLGERREQLLSKIDKLQGEIELVLS